MKPAAALLLPILAAGCDDAGAADRAPPRITFEYSYGYDAEPCRVDVAGTETILPIDPAWVQELLTEELPRLAARWEQDGPALLAGTVALFDHDFRFVERAVTFSLCPTGTTGQGSPLLLPAGGWVDSFVASAQAVDPTFTRYGDEQLVDAVFHELLHLYLSQDAMAPNGLISGTGLPTERMLAHAEYGPEGTIVNWTLLVHLHLAAIEVEVYRSLGRDDVLAAVVDHSRHHPPAYRQAWDTVLSEGTERYLEEVRAALPGFR